YCLEKIFAYATHSPRQTRKCFLILPLCPVYGLAMTLFLAVEQSIPSFPTAILFGSMICTGVEFFVHFFYDYVFQTQFWNYSDLRFHIHGRICPQFALIWGILSTLAARFIHPAIVAVTADIPPAVTFAVWMLLAVDCPLTCTLLYHFHDTELLSLPALVTQQRPSNQSNTSR
ncbi:MAG: putative ABC transporter permease, partial [Oscillospiraceae bacterium]|nr:putative ABC transporter permease [Oscillospiraceae bacterium]